MQNKIFHRITHATKLNIEDKGSSASLAIKTRKPKEIRKSRKTEAYKKLKRKN